MHCISLRMVVLGGIAARLQGVKWLVLAPIGLGHLWLKNNVFEDAARGLSRHIVGRWLRGPGTRYMFENTEDPAEFGLDAGKSPVTIVPGAGVDPRDFPPSPDPPTPPLKVAVVSRMIEAKGIGDAVEAVRRARALGAPVELDLYGVPDPSNRRTCTEADLRRWSTEPGIAWKGATDDIVGRLAHPSCRDAAHLVSRGGAARADRGGGVRAADRDHQCAGLPRPGARPARGYSGSVARYRGRRACSG